MSTECLGSGELDKHGAWAWSTEFLGLGEHGGTLDWVSTEYLDERACETDKTEEDSYIIRGLARIRVRARARIR